MSDKGVNDRVVITDATFPGVEREQFAAQQSGAVFERHACKNADEVAKAVAGAKVAVVQFAELNRAAIEGLAPGATVIRYGVGYNNLDLNALKDLGVKAVYVPDYCTSEVADHTATMLLTQLRKVQQMNSSVREGEWNAVGVAAPMKAFKDTEIGFLGFGRIARAVADRLQPFGFQFLVYDPLFEEEQNNPYSAKKVALDHLISQSDCLSLHAPATEETVGVINADTLKTMKPTAYLVNSARGDLIDEEALAYALANGQIAGAALDVFAQEPLSASSPLRSAPNILLSPHVAWYSDVAVQSLQSLVADEITRALAGEDPRRPIPGF